MKLQVYVFLRERGANRIRRATRLMLIGEVQITSRGSAEFARAEIILRDTFYVRLSSSGVVYPSRNRERFSREQQWFDLFAGWKMNLHCAHSKNGVHRSPLSLGNCIRYNRKRRSFTVT